LFLEKRETSKISGLDVSNVLTPDEKSNKLMSIELAEVGQDIQLENPDSKIILEVLHGDLLELFASAYVGQLTGDNTRFVLFHYELPTVGEKYELFGSTVRRSEHYSGNSQIILWENGIGSLFRYREELSRTLYASGGWKQGWQAWGKSGVRVSQMGSLPATLHCGPHFDSNTATLIAESINHLPAIWCFCSSSKYNEAIRKIDQKRNVTNATLAKVPFDLEYWSKIAKEKYPNGLPKPYSDDPTQWIFHGHPAQSEQALQVAVARLLGYQWPAETDAEMELSDEARSWIEKTKTLSDYVDDDGIVCLSAVRGEKPARERLEELLHAAYGNEWSTNIRNKLLDEVSCKNKSLDVWLREKFFEQHCKLFQYRPFIWHIWDGLKDGFSALVNYHMLDKKNLERLIYTYLDDWIRTQNLQQAEGVDGATERLRAAESLKQRLELILEGEAPYDIFVRWKPLEEQSIGWNPDINDGVRLNIRPFISVTDVGKKDAGVLRAKPNIHWKKDRGKDVESAPWFKLGLEYGGKEGDRINDHHLNLVEKKIARDKKI